MNVQLYWHNLRQEHQLSVSMTAGPGRTEQRLNLLLAGLCTLAVLMVFEIGGYQVGFETMYRLGRHLPTGLIEALSMLGDTTVAICLAALFARRQPRVVWMAVIAGAYATVINHILKNSFHMVRPPSVLGHWVVVAGPVLKLESFPSGHTTTAFLLAACFSVGARSRTKILLYGLAAAAAISRIWMGVHWPIDVIAGAGVAGLSTALAIHTLRLSDWGLRLIPHLFLVSLVAACNVFVLSGGSPYLRGRALPVAIAACALAVLVRDYVIRPLPWQRSGTRDCARH